jgi:predicted short-subunit dehydrogenase-like oxidoreductase (DUF2520 family)
MKFGIIGAGRVGCAFAFALSDRGEDISGVYSKNPESVAFISSRLNRRLEAGLNDLVKNSDIIIICVPDSQIASVSGQISGLCSQADIEGSIFLHCSGALTSDVLWMLVDKGGIVGSLHPIQTFPERENSWNGMFNIYFGFEGSYAARQAASDIVLKLAGKMLEIEAESKPLYHAAACMICNYMVTLTETTGSLLESAGIERNAGIKAFEPLLRKSVANIIEVGSKNALTGPIARGDCITIQEHLSAIDAKIPQIGEMYRVLGKATVQLALAKGSIKNDEALAFLKILKMK